MTRVSVELTAGQLADIINCLRHCVVRGIGYGHLTRQEEALAEYTRERLVEKLARIANPEDEST